MKNFKKIKQKNQMNLTSHIFLIGELQKPPKLLEVELRKFKLAPLLRKIRSRNLLLNRWGMKLLMCREKVILVKKHLKLKILNILIKKIKF